MLTDFKTSYSHPNTYIRGSLRSKVWNAECSGLTYSSS